MGDPLGVSFVFQKSPSDVWIFQVKRGRGKIKEIIISIYVKKLKMHKRVLLPKINTPELIHPKKHF